MTGKPCGDDLRSGKATYLLALAHARARATGASDVVDVLQGCRGIGPLSGAELAQVREALQSTGAPAQVERRIERLMRASDRHLTAAAHREGPALRHLAELLRQVASPHQDAKATQPADLHKGMR